MNTATERLMKWSNGKMAPPLKAQINLTRKCNLKCIFCWQRTYDDLSKFNEKEKFELKKELSEKRLKELVEECGKIGVKEVTITGNGEALLRKNLVLDLMRIVKKHDMKGNLTTNGTLIDSIMARQMVEMGWDYVLISMQTPDANSQDKIRQVKGSYKKTVEGIKFINKWKKKLNKNYPKLAFGIVVFKKNYNKLEKMIKFAKKMNVEFLWVSPIKGEAKNMLKLSLNNQEVKALEKQVFKAKKLAEEFGMITDMDVSMKEVVIKKSNKMDEVVLDDAEKYSELAKILDNDFISKACFEPWLGICLAENGRVGPCQERFGELNQDDANEKSIEKIWKGDYFNNFRKMITDKDLEEKCKFCAASTFYLTKNIRKELIMKSFFDKLSYWEKGGDFNQVESCIKKILNINPELWNVMSYIRSIHMDTGEKDYMEIIVQLENLLNSADSSNVPPEEYQRGLQILNERLVDLVKEKKYDEAIELCDRLNKIVVNNWHLIMPDNKFKEFISSTIGDIYFLRAEYEKARQVYENILKLKDILSQSKFDTYYKLGIIYKRLGQVDKSIDFLNSAVLQKNITPQKMCIALSELAESYVNSKKMSSINEMQEIIKICKNIFEDHFYDTYLTVFALSELAKVFSLIRAKDKNVLCLRLLTYVIKLSKVDKSRIYMHQKLVDRSQKLLASELKRELKELHDSISYKVARNIAETSMGNLLKKILRKSMAK